MSQNKSNLLKNMSSSTTTQPAAACSLDSIIEPPKESSHGHHEIAKRTRLLRIIGRSFLGVMILVGLAMVICWLLVFPKTPTFTLESARVTSHSSTYTKLNASIAFTIKSYNPNKRASIYIDSMYMTLDNGRQIFSATIPTFSQTPGNQTVLYATVEVNFIYRFGRMKASAQSINHVKLHFSGKIRYIINTWMSRRRSFEAYCDQFVLEMNDISIPYNTKCRVDL